MGSSPPWGIWWKHGQFPTEGDTCRHEHTISQGWKLLIWRRKERGSGKSKPRASQIYEGIETHQSTELFHKGRRWIKRNRSQETFLVLNPAVSPCPHTRFPLRPLPFSCLGYNQAGLVLTSSNPISQTRAVSSPTYTWWRITAVSSQIALSQHAVFLWYDYINSPRSWKKVNNQLLWLLATADFLFCRLNTFQACPIL